MISPLVLVTLSYHISWIDPMQDRVQILKTWIEKEGRIQNWVARQVKRSP
jgi:hypothetical protein